MHCLTRGCFDEAIFYRRVKLSRMNIHHIFFFGVVLRPKGTTAVLASLWYSYIFSNKMAVLYSMMEYNEHIIKRNKHIDPLPAGHPKTSKRSDMCPCHSCGRILKNLADVMGGLMSFVTILL